VYSEQCTVNIVQCTVNIVQCIVHLIWFTRNAGRQSQAEKNDQLDETGGNILGLTGYDTVKGTQSYISNQGVE